MPKKPTLASSRKAPYRGGRRRTQAVPLGVAVGAKVVKGLYSRYQAGATQKAKQARYNKARRLEVADNITTNVPVVIGKQREIGFQEQVSRVLRSPLLFKRNYSFSAESQSGRKSMFCFKVNTMSSDDLNTDLTSYKTPLFTDTIQTEATIAGNGRGDGARFYVDKLTEKIRMINSSSNSITGKIHLFAYNRDSGSTYGDTSAIIEPVNMLMYYATSAPASFTAGLGVEQNVGNGWVFQNGGGNNGLNYAAPHNMPGSSINTSGVCAQMDPQLGFNSPHVKEGFSFWFRKVSTSDFSLKPGQQFNSSFSFNDLPIIDREEQAQYVYVKGVSYNIVVEFQAQIVGDATLLSEAVSIGTGQLSVIRENTRTLGMKNTIRSKIILQTAPLANIGLAQQTIINPDTGATDSGVDLDTA